MANSLGTQSISRVAAILRSIARFGPDGARLSDLSRSVQLARPTARRMLKGLMEEHLVVQDPNSRRYRLGGLVFELGLATTQRSHLADFCRPVLRRLAEATGDTIYLVIRSGFEAVCLDRVEGSFPIRTVTLAIGGRRPLGLGAGGLALLASLGDGEVERIIRHHEHELEAYALTAEGWRRAVETARTLQYGYIDGRLTPGVSGIGMAVANPAGTPYAAISIASISSRMMNKRVGELRALLQAEVSTLAALLNKRPSSGGVFDTAPNI